MLTGKVPHARADDGTGSSAQAYGPTSAIRNGQQIIGRGGGSLGTSTLLDVHLDTGWVVVVLFSYADRTTPPIQELPDDTRRTAALNRPEPGGTPSRFPRPEAPAQLHPDAPARDERVDRASAISRRTLLSRASRTVVPVRTGQRQDVAPVPAGRAL
ncbi:MAG: hypothetical protein HOY71_28400 [Nonomuraea sp.]|nr:hypothetical protein [Nonomuraea sp.]